MTWAILFVGFCILCTSKYFCSSVGFPVKTRGFSWKWIALIGAAATLVVTVVQEADAHYYAGCRHSKCKRHVVRPHNAHLQSIHNCEMRGRTWDWHFNGQFDGGLQFGPPTWNATHSLYSFAYQAPILEQKYRGVIWAHMIGWNWRSTAGWPNCG